MFATLDFPVILDKKFTRMNFVYYSVFHIKMEMFMLLIQTAGYLLRHCITNVFSIFENVMERGKLGREGN
jgi:hypothetical protein